MSVYNWCLTDAGPQSIESALSALDEYKFTRTRQRGRVAAGDASSLLRTHRGVFGLSYHF